MHKLSNIRLTCHCRIIKSVLPYGSCCLHFTEKEKPQPMEVIRWGFPAFTQGWLEEITTD